MRPNLRKSWQRKQKKVEKKLSNCLAPPAICPPKKLGYNRPQKVTREKMSEAARAPCNLVIYWGWVGINTGRFVSLVAIIRVTINLVMN